MVRKVKSPIVKTDVLNPGARKAARLRKRGIDPFTGKPLPKL